jgi:site-specific recombinase XerD
MFSRKLDADRFAREVEVDKERGDWFDPRAGHVLVRDWAATWLKASISLSPTSIQTYRRDLDDSVLPRCGATRLSKVIPEDIEAWLADELDVGLAPSSVHRHYRTLRRRLQFAVERDRIAKNPCVNVRPSRVQLRPMAILTWREGVALAEAHPPTCAR